MRTFTIAAVLTLFFFLPTATLATTEVSGVISGNTTWTLADSPYVVTETLTIPADATLTIEPGVAVKFSDTMGMVIFGNIIADGTTTAPIIFTSLRDDTAGGDTNGDSTATTPNPMDWEHILVKNGATGTFQNVTVRYGGFFESGPPTTGIQNDGGAVLIRNSSIVDNGNDGFTQTNGSSTIMHTQILRQNLGITIIGGGSTIVDTTVSGGDIGLYTYEESSITHIAISSSTFTNNSIGIASYTQNLTIRNSRIYGNQQFGLTNDSVGVIDAGSNWWGHASGPRHESNQGGTGNRIFGDVTFTPWLTTDPMIVIPPPPPPPTCIVDCNSNVLFLPGIMGSRIYWTDPSCLLINCENKLWIPNRNDDVENLYMATGTSLLSSIYTKEDDILLEGTFLDKKIYKAFADEMNSMVASGTIEAWKPIAYDWRYGYDHLLAGGLNIDGKIYYDVPTSFPYILEELHTLAASSRTGKVTIVAHSNGGLLAKTLIQKLKDAGQADLIDNLVLVASPQLGTPQAIGALLHGYDASGLKYYVGMSAQRKLAHDMPMTYNLLPSEKYLSTVSTPVITFDEDIPANTLWGDEINNTGEYLAYLLGGDNRSNPDFGELEDPAIANETLLTSALEWHANFDDWVAPTTTTVYQIAGWGNDTVSGIRYSNDAWLSDFSWDYEPILTEDGDGTVVTPSALGNDGQKYWVDLNEYKDETGNNLDHGKIFEVPQLRTLIKNVIRKEDITDPGQYISTTRPSAINIEKRLRYFLHSPLTLELYDNEGRHVGVSTTTGQIEEQIPGASYDEFGEVKYISVPAGAPTTLVMRGEGEGRFTLNVQEVTGGVVTATTTFANIPVSTSTFVTMSIAENPVLSALPGLSIDQDGNGTIDTYIFPGTVLVPDVTEPELQITFGTSTRQLLFVGLDTSSTSVVSSFTSTTVTDAPGNTLYVPYLQYKEKNRRTLLSFNTLVYNGSTTTIATTTVKYKWKTDASGKFTMFAAFIKTGSITIEAHYRPKKNQTIIMSKPTDFDDSDADDDCDNRPIKMKLRGLIIPRVQTSGGSINIIY